MLLALILIAFQAAPTTAATPAVLATPAVAATSCPVRNKPAHYYDTANPMPAYMNGGDKMGTTEQSPASSNSQAGAGFAEVTVYLNEDGQVSHVQLFESSGNSRFDDAALKAATTGTYSAAIKDCIPVKSVIIVTPSDN